MYAENYISRCLGECGLGEVHIGGRNFIGLVDLNELGYRLGNHGATGFKRLRSLGKKNVRGRNGWAEGAGRHFDPLQIGNVQKIGVVGDGGKVTGFCDPFFFLIRRDGIRCRFQSMIRARSEIDCLLEGQFAFLPDCHRHQAQGTGHYNRPSTDRVISLLHKTFLQAYFMYSWRSSTNSI